MWGWHEVRRVESHCQLQHEHRSGTVTVPIHSGEIIKPRVL
ncbi:MAG: type II toxin-antitoxin system HicA family toxin [Dehalococcoidia bacterium]